MKRCGFVIRVSTEQQAANEEGSLKNQLQRLRAHVEYKTTACGEQWQEARCYVLKAISGKDSFRSKEFAELFEDIRTGKINTVVCTALDRISRSVRDFLNFFEILSEYDVEFVCLKQNYDTTTPQGKLFTTIMMALAQFEREQTSDRTREAALARAERGLWNGGQLLGYDLNPDKHGHLIPNAAERATVNFGCDIYLKCGSILETMKAMNERGYRTKEFTSRRGKFHPGKPFNYSAVQWMLTNYAYIGKKEIGKKKWMARAAVPPHGSYQIVDAVWEPIVDEGKFYAVQALMRKNAKSRHNAAKPVKHNYILNGELLECGKCGSQMEGTCGTGKKGVRYYYYICKNPACRFKVPAGEIEGLVLERIGQLAGDKETMAGIVAATNERLKTELPRLRAEKELLERELEKVKTVASGLINEWTSLATADSGPLLREKLDELGKRRGQIETSLASLELTTAEIEREAVDQDLVMKALADFSRVFAEIQPHKQKELLRLVLHKAILGPDYVKMALYGRPPEIGPLATAEPRTETLNWLLGQGSNLQPSG